ncbi:unnamed protein product [Protopolystoma xenopodis]|uniref:Far upstream element-binding protein C-terminal domain-containing protein n=1 Tax=Protopolystoma xenopodis TaxID=117903 RepID=A0A448WGA1_9PLAT|nr:unnamed protein product [Protopolystoma xenopodis]
MPAPTYNPYPAQPDYCAAWAEYYRRQKMQGYVDATQWQTQQQPAVVAAAPVPQQAAPGMHPSQAGMHQAQAGMHQAQAGMHQAQAGMHPAQAGMHQTQAGMPTAPVLSAYPGQPAAPGQVSVLADFALHFTWEGELKGFYDYTQWQWQWQAWQQAWQQQQQQPGQQSAALGAPPTQAPQPAGQ